MRRLTSQDREFDFPAHDPARRAQAIAAMGYRLAAAGPRTRQRLLDRGPVQGAPSEPQVVWLAPGIVGEDAAQAWADEAGHPGLARLSSEQPGFPVWRMGALAASAACGFALVLYAQGLHLDRKPHHQTGRDTKKVEIAQPAQGAQAAAPIPPAAPAARQQEAAGLPRPSSRPEAPAGALVQPPSEARTGAQEALAPSPATPPAGNPQQSDASAQTAPQPAPVGAPAAGSAQTRPAGIAPAPALAGATDSAAAPAPQAAATAVQAPLLARPRAAPASRLFAAQPRPAPRRAIFHPVLAMAERPVAPRAAEPKPHAPIRTASVHYDLPHWLTDVPAPAPAPQHVLVMSPPPHNLDNDAPAKPAAKPAPAQRPALIYAEAHDAPPARPYATTPYYAPYYYPPGYGYYAQGSP